MEHPESHLGDDDPSIDEEWGEPEWSDEESWSPDNECPECGYTDGQHRLEPIPCPNA